MSRARTMPPPRGPWDARARTVGWPAAEIAEIAARMASHGPAHSVRVEAAKITWVVDQVFDFGVRRVTSPRAYVQRRAIHALSRVLETVERPPWCSLHGRTCGPTADGCGHAGTPTAARDLCACPPGLRHAYGCELRTSDRACCVCPKGFRPHLRGCPRHGLKAPAARPSAAPVTAPTASAPALGKVAKRRKGAPLPGQTSLGLAVPAKL